MSVAIFCITKWLVIQNCSLSLRREAGKKSFSTLPRNFKTKESQDESAVTIPMPKERHYQPSTFNVPTHSKDSHYESLVDGSLSSSGYEDTVFVDGKYSPMESGMAQKLARMGEQLAAMEASLTALREGGGREKAEQENNIWKDSINERLKVE